VVALEVALVVAVVALVAVVVASSGVDVAVVVQVPLVLVACRRLLRWRLRVLVMRQLLLRLRRRWLKRLLVLRARWRPMCRVGVLLLREVVAVLVLVLEALALVLRQQLCGLRVVIALSVVANVIWRNRVTARFSPLSRRPLWLLR
jgi:hypothetical protein